MPLDPRPHPTGNVVVATLTVAESSAPGGAYKPRLPHAVVVGMAGELPPGVTTDAPGYMAHWATCARRPSRRDERACAVPGCGRLVRRRYLMCWPHWNTLPFVLRARVRDLYKAIHDRGEPLRREYLAARKDAIAYVLGREAGR